MLDVSVGCEGTHLGWCPCRRRWGRRCGGLAAEPAFVWWTDLAAGPLGCRWPGVVAVQKSTGANANGCKGMSTIKLRQRSHCGPQRNNKKQEWRKKCDIGGLEKVRCKFGQGRIPTVIYRPSCCQRWKLKQGRMSTVIYQRSNCVSGHNLTTSNFNGCIAAIKVVSTVRPQSAARQKNTCALLCWCRDK